MHLDCIVNPCLFGCFCVCVCVCVGILYSSLHVIITLSIIQAEISKRHSLGTSHDPAKAEGLLSICDQTWSKFDFFCTNLGQVPRTFFQTWLSPVTKCTYPLMFQFTTHFILTSFNGSCIQSSEVIFTSVECSGECK